MYNVRRNLSYEDLSKPVSDASDKVQQRHLLRLLNEQRLLNLNSKTSNLIDKDERNFYHVNVEGTNLHPNH
jgi:hypothetical protein